MDTSTILMIGGGLGLLFLIVGVLVSVLGERSVVEERLGRYSETGGLLADRPESGEQALERRRSVADFFNRFGEGTDLFEGISRDLARADLKLLPVEYIALRIGTAGLGGIIGMFAGRGSIPFAVVAAIVGAFVPNIYVKMAQRTRLKQFDNQLTDMLNLVVNGLRAGFSTLQAMEAVSRELPKPISVEFHRVVQEMQLGLQMEEALDHLMRRISSDDLDLVVTAINVQREVGGNLAEILDVISYTIRERVRLKGQISALTAQGRATAWVIAALPIVLVLLLFTLNREYIMTLFLPENRACGIPIIILAALLIVTGFIAVQKIVAIDI
ncbi:MAG TPA: secretion system protein [Anaerolineae bacterium]|nr:secretion system protein [Anaerolineae bacterium]